MIPLSELIWISAQPLIRLFLCVAAGFILAKAGCIPSVVSRGAGQIILNITLPCLLFSRIVPAFNSLSINAVGPLVLVALLYEAIGIAMSWIIKQIFWVPHRFQRGILVAGGWGNIGDIPTSVVMSLTTSAFKGTFDENLAIASISVFLLIFMITLFPLGCANLVAMDFQGPDVIDEDVQEQLKIKQQYLGAATERAVISLKGLLYLKKRHLESSDYDAEKEALELPVLARTTIVQHTPQAADTETEPPVPLRRRLVRFGSGFVQTLISPCSASIILGFIIAIIPVLKALFIPGVPGVNVPPAPDGQPPLAVLLNTMTFIGGASVPLGLMTLGSALSRLEAPGGRLRSLPLGAIGALAIGRMVVMPVFGVLITQGLTRAGMLNANDNVLRFVCIFLSCVPSGMVLVFLTQVYSGTGDAQHLSVFLIPQYILMFFTMTPLTGYTLHLLFG